MIRAIVFLCLLSIAAFATPVIVNGNFDSGNASFYSSYNFVPYPTPSTPDPQHLLYPEGDYTVGTNPNDVHNLWPPFSDHTTGFGNMMIVNGMTTLDSSHLVWRQTATGVAAANQTYTFSFWAALIYPQNPPTLTVTVDGQTVGSFNMQGDAPDQWYHYSAQFTGSGSAPTFSISDSVVEKDGNDFALDDITITTPEPAAWMFAAGGAALMFLLRRLRKA